MNVNCTDCGSVFRVDPAKVAPEGVRAKCSICGGVIQVAGRDARRSTPVVTSPSMIDMTIDPQMNTTAERAVGASGKSVAMPVSDVVELDNIPMEAPRHLTPMAPAPIVAPPVAPPPSVPRPAITPPVRTPTPRTTMPTAVPPAAPAAGATAAGLRAGPAGIAGAPARPAAPPATPARPAAPLAASVRPPASATPVRPPAPPATPVRPADVAPPASRPTPLNVPMAPTPVSVPLAPTPVSAPSVATPLFNTPVAGAETTPRRPVNPFLANDPGAKAKRLARALVSDMIAYLPQKREEGLREGTLKQIFREEIKKSYEEYVDQIGREIAENTTHFQEALNDLLAGGQKIF